MTIERRIAGQFTKPSVSKVRTAGKTTTILRGYASVWYRPHVKGTEYDFDWFTERIAKGAFSKVIAERQDVRGLFNHDSNWPLGRTAAGTLELWEDHLGLGYEIQLADGSTRSNDLAIAIARGDVTGSSFSFTVAKESWQMGKDRDIRIIEEIATLYDVGPVTFPAYKSASSTIVAAPEADRKRKGPAPQVSEQQLRNRRIAISRGIPLDCWPVGNKR